MASLRWAKKGASSVIQFGLLHPKLDPGFIALVDTVCTFRSFCNPDVVYAILTGLITSPPRHFDPGPCAVVLARLHEIKWRWEGNGFLADHEGLTLHLLDCPVQLLKLRLQQAWERQVGCSIQERKDFGGLGQVDGDLSRIQWGNTQEEKGILRSVMNGTFYTRDKQIHAGKVPSKTCPFCSQEDSLQHRIWHCSAFEDLRMSMPHHVRSFLDQQPDCTRLHAWVVESTADKEWRKLLHSLPGHHACVGPVPADPVLHLFADGGCLNPTVPHLRLASWAFCIANLEADRFDSGASGILSGMYQTPLRAEIQAAVEAIKFACQHGRKFCLWTDNQQVFDRIKRYILPEARPPLPKQRDHDLWGLLFSCVGRGRELFQDVVKVVSHLDIHSV